MAASLERFLSASTIIINLCNAIECKTLTSLLFSFDFSHNGFDLDQVEVLQGMSKGVGYTIVNHKEAYSNFSIALHNADLDILRACLYDLQQTLHSKLNTLFSSQIVFVILLQKFTDGFRRTTNGVCLRIKITQ